MKSLQLSSIMLCFFVIFASCTKSPDDLLEPSTAVTDPAYALYGRGNGGPIISSPQSDEIPEMNIHFNPDPATAGQPVTVTGELTGIAPACGKLQLQQWDGTDWVKVTDDVNVSAGTSAISFVFTPTTAGSYKFRMHYIAQNCAGYKQGFSNEFSLEVVPACQGLTLNGAIINARPVDNNLYEFTVAYTVSSCNVSFDHLKTQGGLTNAVSLVQASTGASMSQPGNSSNKIIKWEETSADGSPLSNNTRTYEITFTRAYAGTGNITITGEWSTTATRNGVEVVRANFPQLEYSR